MSRHVLALFGTIAILAGCAGDRATPMWKGSASVVDGIEIVSNPDAPLFGNEDVPVVELWRVRPGISDSMWTDPTRLLATENGVYVLDPPSSSIVVISPTGEHQLSFGGTGMGPGELRNPGALAVVDSLIAVLNGGNGRIEFFTPAGKYSHSKRLPGPPFSMLGTEHGHLARANDFDQRTCDEAGGSGPITSTVAPWPGTSASRQSVVSSGASSASARAR